MTKHETTLTMHKGAYQIPSIEEFINAVMTLPDQKEARTLVEEQAGLIFDIASSAELSQLETDITDTQEPYNQSQKSMAEQQRHLSVTTPTIKAAAYLGDVQKTNTATGKSLAQVKDIIVGLTALLLGCVVVLMGGSNVYAIIMASGTPAFLDNPNLAIMLSGLLPIGSVALKFFANYLPNDKTKKRYTMVMYGLSALSLIAWVILFGLTFKSSGAGIDWDSFDTQTSGSKDELFTIIQLLSELFIGATLFIVAGDTFSIYSPTTLIPNPAYQEHKQNLETLRRSHEKLAEEYKQKQGRLKSLNAARKAYINTQLAAYMQQAARLNGIPTPTTKKQKETKKMKNFVISTLFGLALLTGVNGEAQARKFMIGISPALSENEAKAQTKELLQFLTQEIQPSEQALIFDAWSLQSIGTFSVPTNAAYNVEKAKLQANRSLVAKLMRRNRRYNASLTNTVKGAVKLPQFLQFLGENYGPLNDTDILILGSPIYLDIQNPQMSMTEGRLASDGHFTAPPSDTPFSIIGKENLLNGARIHIFIRNRNWAINDHYAYLVKRMWTLFIVGQGAVLSNFTSDAQTYWLRVSNNADALPHSFKRNELAGKLETLVIANKQKNTLPIYERDLTTTPPNPSALRMAEHVEIGISWNCSKCDFDLYVRPHNNAEVLYFGRTKTTEGLYHKDFTQSPQPNGGFETASFTVPVDLRDTLIAINWYGGKASGNVSGEIRLAIGEKTYGLPFQIKAGKGNASIGRDQTLASGKSANKNWLIIKPKDILGL